MLIQFLYATATSTPSETNKNNIAFILYKTYTDCIPQFNNVEVDVCLLYKLVLLFVFQ